MFNLYIQVDILAIFCIELLRQNIISQEKHMLS